MTTSASWGNPDHSTFERRNIRLAAADTLQVRVHQHLASIVRRILADLSEANLKVGTLEGYPTYRDGRSLTIALDPPAPEQTVAAMQGYGFRRRGGSNTKFDWAGTAEEAAARSAEIEAEEQALLDAAPGQNGADNATADAAGTETPNEDAEAAQGHVAGGALAEAKESEDWEATRPGGREIGPGDCGRDVLFIQAYLNAPRTGRYDDATVKAVRDLRVLRGMDEGDGVDGPLWRVIIPALVPRLHPGDAGRTVRVASAAMIAAGYEPDDAPVHARFGIALSGAVRRMQTQNGHRPTPRIGGLEWELLIDRPRR